MTTARQGRPSLSVVATSRNDVHGGSMLKRMRLFVQGVLDQTRRFQLPLELIIVEWNPPSDRPLLGEVLPRPSPHDCVTLRYVRVPAAVHQRYRRAAEIPLFQMIAKNVGIRRATGAFVLCTNMDLLFSDALVAQLAHTPLSADTYYRANRCDVPDGLDPAWTISEQLGWCERHVIRRLGRDPRYRHINLELVGLQGKSRFKKWLFDKAALVKSSYWTEEQRLLCQLDTVACGDFTLMAREAWVAIQGYVELDLYSLHIDSLGLIAATALGYRQHVFPAAACTYHIDHPSGWEAMSPVEQVRFLEQRPAIDYGLLQQVGLHALRRRQRLGLNAETWGYADREFEETVFRPESTNSRQVMAAVASAGA